jgi:CheY-like chemotaxis protein
MPPDFDQPAFILIVEDEEDIAVLYSELLTSAGYRVAIAADAFEALERVRRAPPDLIVMDIGLPQLDGCAATRQLKANERTRGIPVLALTGYVQPRDREEALAAGCDGWLLKPCALDQLLAEVRRLLTRRTPRSVLIVEDDDDIRISLAESLALYGYEVALARDGQEALDRLRSGLPQPRLILLDLMMPGVDGWQFRAEQEKDPRLSEIPVVVLSAVEGITPSGVKEHLTKPVDMAVLLSTVDKHAA